MVLDKVKVGSLIFTNGMALRLVESRGNGVFWYQGTGDNPVEGEIFFNEESQEGNDLYIIEE